MLVASFNKTIRNLNDVFVIVLRILLKHLIQSELFTLSDASFQGEGNKYLQGYGEARQQR